MAIVSVAVFPGLSPVQKEFIVRGIVDVIAEHAGVSREKVQVLIHEVPRDGWAIGPRLASTRITESAGTLRPS